MIKKALILWMLTVYVSVCSLSSTGSVEDTHMCRDIGLRNIIYVGGLGFVLFGKQTNGTIDKLSVGQEMTIPTGMIFGLGPVIVTLIVQNSEALPLVKRMIAELLFFYIKL